MNNIMTYLLMGTAFMFVVELVANTKTYKKMHKSKPPLGYKERIVGILAWPACVAIFIFSFFKQYFK